MPAGHLPVVSYMAVPVLSRSGSVIGGLLFGHPEPGKFTKEHEDIIISIASQAAIGIDNAVLYEEVKTLNEKKDEFIGLASHELKTPLTSISGYLQIINRLKTDDNTQKFVDKTIHQVKKLTSLVSDLLDVSKIEAGKLQLIREKFDIRAVVDDAVELMHYSNENYQLSLQTDIESLIMNGDPNRIEQVLINLLNNAIKYSPGNDKIEILLSHTESEVKIGIKDFGMGIASDKLTHIFSRFYRVEGTNHTISGLGIGLYLSHEIITRHNGNLWVESELGKGSTFWLTLPLLGHTQLPETN
jgi:signal transduction histidine kinase